MEYLVAAAVGAALGVGFAAGRIPSPRPVALWATALLAVAAATALVYWSPSNLLAGLALVLAGVVSTCLYGAALWAREGLGACFGYWQLAWRVAVSPRRLRDLAASLEKESGETVGSH